MSPNQASKKSNESEVYTNLQDKRQKRKPKYKLGDLVRNIFSKGDSTTWSDKLYTITEIIDDTIPSYRIDNFPERYIEALLKKSKLTYDDNKNFMKKLNLFQLNIIYRIDFLPERYNEAILKKSFLTCDENEFVMEKLNIISNNKSIINEVLEQ